MERKSKPNSAIPGTRPSPHNAQLLLSSGIPTLDELLGGGLPVGSVALVEEDTHGTYGKVILKYFLAEGVVNKHSLFLCSQDVSAKSIIADLPAAIDSDPEPEQQRAAEEKMKIAFRYHNLPTTEKPVPHQFGHYYDLSKVMLDDDFEDINVTYWEPADTANELTAFANPAYQDLLMSIKSKLENHLCVGDTPKTRTVLRVGIHALGSPMWFPNSSNGQVGKSRDLDLFFYCLRGLMRSAFAVALVTIPSHIYPKGFLGRCIHSSDVALRLQAFAGTELEKNPSLSEYHGFFYVEKLAAINSLVSKHPGSVEYVFKLRRKKFAIQKLHLPPALEDLSEELRKREKPSLGCGSSTKHLLEF